MADVNCVECEGDITLEDDVVESEVFQCPDCGAELEVLGLKPLAIALAPEVEEDWGE